MFEKRLLIVELIFILIIAASMGLSACSNDLSACSNDGPDNPPYYIEDMKFYRDKHGIVYGYYGAMSPANTYVTVIPESEVSKIPSDLILGYETAEPATEASDSQ